MPAEARFAVRAQGIDPQAQRATGDDAEVAMGEMTLEEIGGLIDRVLALPIGGGDCPPHLIVTGARGATSLIIEGGAISSDSGRSLTREQALARIGARRSEAPELPAAAFPRGMVPLRHAELAPTQPEVKENPRLIDAGPAASRATLRVWKGRGWSAAAWFFLGFAIFLAAIAALSSLPGPKPSSGGGVAGFWVVAVLCAVIYFVVRRAGKESCTIGIDWKTNTLWLSRTGGMAFEPHASCIRDVQARHLRIADGVQFIQGGLPVKRGSDLWTLQIEYSDGHAVSALKTHFLARKEAEAVAASARRLIAA